MRFDRIRPSWIRPLHPRALVRAPRFRAVGRCWSIHIMRMLLAQSLLAVWTAGFLLAEVFSRLSLPALCAPACSVVRVADHQPAAYPEQDDGGNDADSDDEADSSCIDASTTTTFYESRRKTCNGWHFG